jgi:chloride channel 7
MEKTSSKPYTFVSWTLPQIDTTPSFSPQSLAPRGKRFQVIEAAVIALLTSVVGYSMALAGHCKPCPDPVTHPHVTCPRRSGHFGNFVNFGCASQTGEYNPLATLFLSTNDDAIRNLFSTNTPFEYPERSLFLFFVSFYSLAIITYGVAVPSGLFVPAILSGATYGRLMGVLLTRQFGPEAVDEGRYALIGAASFLGGSMRMTVSSCTCMSEMC